MPLKPTDTASDAAVTTVMTPSVPIVATPTCTPETITGTTAKAPSGVSGDYVGVTITGEHPDHPGWSRPSRFYFRKTADGWMLVGVERG